MYIKKHLINAPLLYNKQFEDGLSRIKGLEFSFIGCNQLHRQYHVSTHNKSLRMSKNGFIFGASFHTEKLTVDDDAQL